VASERRTASGRCKCALFSPRRTRSILLRNSKQLRGGQVSERGEQAGCQKLALSVSLFLSPFGAPPGWPARLGPSLGRPR